MRCAAGYLVSPLLLARFDCRTVNIANYAVMSVILTVLGAVRALYCFKYLPDYL